MCLGIPAQVVAISDPDHCMGVVDISGVRREADLTCVAGDNLDDLVGAWVLVHVGFAMSIIDEDEARTTLELLAALGDAEAELAAMRDSQASLEASQ
ncbi:HypC/HybG/HupF family hydrogenase formation chaperone [Asticcacaulis sp. 201]|uniref:HypC/HybG/HupF family hydrogenase formation chaperone n=1 Tax=Asticcacaulis sp. 201 TaxID=3028787 RepID=UPI0029165F0C|nr:HypC/HybG/HupF family hydrogenase formation chaperone [Asticcacaulis sp. 201]MDV6330607.1 HypC/HybG/HupF family hydrogenase formation chaperone [Asticcacaulis sp. 201]